MSEPTRHTAYVMPELSAARVEAQWARIAEKLPPPPTRQRAWRLFALTALVTACAGVLVAREYWPQSQESVWEGSLVASDDAPVNVTLAEGTVIELDPHSEVSLMRSRAEAVQVQVAEGGARFDVRKKRGRRFTVQLGQVEVLVTGTRFRVARSMMDGGERVRVFVEEGAVEVRRRGASTVKLQAGDRWSAFVADEHVEADPPGHKAEEVPQAQDEGTDARREERDTSENQAPLPGRTRRLHARAEQSAAAESLFEQANVARRAGRMSEAARLYDELAQRHTHDRRAALAAFELGRIRMDSLADMRGAVEALDRALKLDARRAFAEDALARLVLAYEALGDKTACVLQRERYLSRYPEGVHASYVATRCGGI